MQRKSSNRPDQIKLKIHAGVLDLVKEMAFTRQMALFLGQGHMQISQERDNYLLLILILVNLQEMYK